MQGTRIIDQVVEIDVVVDTAIHAALDVVCQPTELPLIAQKNGTAVIISLVLTDYDDQGVALNAIFLRSPITVGVNNAPWTVSDNEVGEVLGCVTIGTGDYLNFPLNQVATVKNIGLEVQPLGTPKETSQSVWVALRVPTETPTYVSGRLTLKVGVLRG